MSISQIIKQFGYRRNEVKVYLASLAALESTASQIATKAKLPLSSTQAAIQNLHKEGLMNFYLRKTHKYWVAEPPEKLVNILKEKEERLASALKEIQPYHRKTDGKPKVRVFIGDDEIKLIHNQIIEKKQYISAVIPWEAWNNLLGKEYLDDFINLRVNHFLDMRMLVPKTLNTIKLKTRDSKELRHTKFLHEDMVIEDALFIFGDTVAIITLNEQQPTGIVIEDPATTRMMTIIFEDFWKRASE